MRIFFTALIVLSLLFFGFNKITEQIEQKVNEKIDKTIDNGFKKFDSSLKNINIDSIKNKLDSLSIKEQTKDKNRKSK